MNCQGIKLLYKKNVHRPSTQSLFIKNFTCLTQKLIPESSSDINRYEFGFLLGSGSYATVWEAWDKHKDMKIAVKIYEKAKFVDAQKRTNLKWEVEILRILKHKNIIQLFDTVETISTVNLIMEYVCNQNLREFIKKQKERQIQDPSKQKFIFRQIAEALNYCHTQQVCHRDLKLENILIDSSLNIKLIDFGFSIRSRNLAKLKIFCGTPSYMAPEIV
jgi:MAP/microtubule affinity-regulating kinase